MRITDKVWIKDGFHKGNWGIVKGIIAGEYFVAIADGTDWLPFERNQLQRQRLQ